MTRRFVLSALFLYALIGSAPAAQEAIRALADSARDKFDHIIAIGDARRNPRAPTHTELSALEINAYFHVYGPEVLPPSVTRPQIRLGENGRVWARAIVDLTEVRKSRPRTWRDPLAYVAGAVEVVASGRVEVNDGLGRARLESATVAGISIPNTAVQELIRFYTVTDDRPDGFDLDEPFELPANILEVVVEHDRATIVQ